MRMRMGMSSKQKIMVIAKNSKWDPNDVSHRHTDELPDSKAHTQKDKSDVDLEIKSSCSFWI